MSIVNPEDLNHHINYHGSLSLMTKESKTSNLVRGEWKTKQEKLVTLLSLLSQKERNRTLRSFLAF